MANPRFPTDDDQAGDAAEAFRALFASAARAQAEREPFAKAARAACVRLVRACYGHDNSQAQTVAAALASIYNGQAARGVRLDEIRWLDWQLQRDLITVMIGTGVDVDGATPFSDSDIRAVFEEVGGKSGVEELHWWTTGGAHKAALRRLVEFIVANRQSSSAVALLDFLRSFHGTGRADLSRLNYMEDELTVAAVMVLDGLVGRDQGALHAEDLANALNGAKLL